MLSIIAEFNSRKEMLGLSVLTIPEAAEVGGQMPDKPVYHSWDTFKDPIAPGRQNPFSVFFQPAKPPTWLNPLRTPSTRALAIPCAFLLLPSPLAAAAGFSKGRTLSLALKLTKSAKGTSHTQIPK